MRRRAGTLITRAATLIIASTLVTAPACSDGAPSATELPAADVVLRVVTDGEVAADWTLAELEAAVSFTELTVDGDEQSGPLLLDVLEASGIANWESGRVVGWGEGRAFEVTVDIAAADVDDGWILDVTNRGSLKLATAELPRAQWVRDVGEIILP